MLKTKNVIFTLAFLLNIITNNPILAKGGQRNKAQAQQQLLQQQPVPARQTPQAQQRPQQAPQQQVARGQQQPQLQQLPQAHQQTQTPLEIINYRFGAGSVLPFFTDSNGIKYLILSRESERGRSKDKGTYDDFGGSRDYDFGPLKNEPEPYYFAAAREFYEEAILKDSCGLSLSNTIKFIDVASNNTHHVIAFSSGIIYITDFSLYKDALFKNFYTALRNTKNRHSREKDRIALVNWQTIETLINNDPINSGRTVTALVLCPPRRSLCKNPLTLYGQQWSEETITLRPWLVKKLRPFFMNKPYQEDVNNKIRRYDQFTRKPVITPAPMPAPQRITPSPAQAPVVVKPAAVAPAVKATPAAKIPQRAAVQQPRLPQRKLAPQRPSWWDRFWDWVDSK